VASPAELIVATAGFAAFQPAVAVTLAVEPSLYVAIAVNCSVAPAATLALGGETAIDVTVFVAAGTVSVAIPAMPLTEAVMVVEPAAIAVASPAELIVATAAFAAVQLAIAVTLAVEPSLYVAIAVNCCVPPAATLALGGESVMDESVFVAAGTVSVAIPAAPFSEAVMVVEPAAIPNAIPAELTVATDVSALVQLAVEVTFAVEPSLYAAIAVNCSVAPIATFALVGEVVIAVSVFPEAVPEPGAVLALDDTPHPILPATSGTDRKTHKA
jgi:hypothetical protein